MRMGSRMNFLVTSSTSSGMVADSSTTCVLGPSFWKIS
uniref:Uncharacterized protein n=1 Tax=Anguilla anguilla TaxID=7936 RepID=A0A0E9XT08_ANGAN